MNKLPTQNFQENLNELFKTSPLGERLEKAANPASIWLGRELACVWSHFLKKLETVPFVQSLEKGEITREEYMNYLKNMYAQVSQGARWLAQAIASMENSHIILRESLIHHLHEEHQDYKMLIKDYLAMGGKQEELIHTSMNIGSEALSTYILNAAKKPNPVALLGATFIIEGLGSSKAKLWCDSLQKTLNLSKDETSFLYYHGVADIEHYENLIKLLSSPFVTTQTALEIARTAKVVGRLYALQLEEM